MSTAPDRCPVCDGLPEPRGAAVTCLRCAARRLRSEDDGTRVRVVRVDGGIEVRVFVPDGDSEDELR